MQMTAELSPTEEAFVAMTLQRHAATVRQADAEKAAAIDILLRDRGIPEGTPVTAVARTNTAPACLTYEIPDTGTDTVPHTSLDA